MEWIFGTAADGYEMICAICCNPEEPEHQTSCKTCDKRYCQHCYPNGVTHVEIFSDNGSAEWTQREVKHYRRLNKN